jgi:hypothetical protein
VIRQHFPSSFFRLVFFYQPSAMSQSSSPLRGVSPRGTWGPTHPSHQGGRPTFRHEKTDPKGVSRADNRAHEHSAVAHGVPYPSNFEV